MTILPVVSGPGVRPNCSAQATRTAGATWTTVVISGSARASSTGSVSSRSRRAAVGQWVTHWPQKAQSASRMVRLWLTLTDTREPVPATSQMFRDWILSQTWMHRMHLMHLLSWRIRGAERSHWLLRMSMG